jgi:hypothetical protein
MNYIVLKIMHVLAGLRLFYHQFGLYMLTDQQAVMLPLCSLTASDIGVDGELGESGEEKYMMLQISTTNGGQHSYNYLPRG